MVPANLKIVKMKVGFIKIISSFLDVGVETAQR